MVKRNLLVCFVYSSRQILPLSIKEYFNSSAYLCLAVTADLVGGLAWQTTHNFLRSFNFAACFSLSRSPCFICRSRSW